MRDTESDKDFRGEGEEEGRAAAFHPLLLPTSSQLKTHTLINCSSRGAANAEPLFRVGKIAAFCSFVRWQRMTAAKGKKKLKIKKKERKSRVWALAQQKQRKLRKGN